MSDKESLGLHELKQHKPWFDEEYSFYFGSKEACYNAVVTGYKQKQFR